MPTMPLLAWLMAGASAQTASVDIELVSPAMSSGGGFVTETGLAQPADSWRFGWLAQLEDEPLVLYDQGARVGTVVGRRASLHLGAGYQIGEAFSLRATLPVAHQWGSEGTDYAADLTGAGDLVLGARVRVHEGKAGGVAFSLDQRLPVGVDEAWLGEVRAWRSYGFLGSIVEERLIATGHLQLAARPRTSPMEQPLFGTEIRASGAILYEVRPNLRAMAEVVARHGFLSSGGVTPMEGLLGARVSAAGGVSVDVGVGTGLSRGYGTTRSRLLLGLTWAPRDPAAVEERRPLPEPEPEIVRVAPPPVPDEVIVTREWLPGELARIEGDEIVIREPILFELGTARILPESLPVLDSVASVLDENDRIAHLVVEGHASVEGDYQDNYDLSVLRAKAIFERLVTVGVDARRLSYRGMGEVVPAEGGAEQLEANRRVIFHIVHLLGPLEIAAPRSGDAKLPWSGEPQSPGARPAEEPSP